MNTKLTTINEGLEVVNRVKLLMRYDMSKTSVENKSLVEQSELNNLGDVPKWYTDTEKEPEKETSWDAIKDLVKIGTNPGSFQMDRARKYGDEIQKDKKEIGAERMSDQERNQLFYVVPLPPNNQNKKTLLIPKLWDEDKKTYTGEKNTYTVFGKQSPSEEMKSFGIDKWKGTSWQNWIPTDEKWRQLFPENTLRSIWIGDHRYSATATLPEKGEENTSGNDYIFNWYLDYGNSPYVEKDFLNPRGKDPYPKRFSTPWWEDSHIILELSQMALCFLPPAGPIIGAALGIINAGQYYEEGKNYDAGLQVVFALLPVALEIPGVKELGSKGMAALASKFSKAIPQGTQKVSGEMLKNFTEQELNVISEVTNTIKNNPEFVAQKLNDAGIKLIETAANKDANQVAKELLKKTSKTKLIMRNAGKFVSGMAPYIAADIAYGQAYGVAASNLTLKGKIEKNGFKWEEVKTKFQSSGSENDNKLLSQAWDKGWRPGKPVPEEFKTIKYKEVEREEK
jgi:hypothetical protein